MDQELFNGTAIDEPSDDENLAFGKPNTLGSKVLSYLKLKGLFLRLADATQTVLGVVTFNKSPIVPDPTTNLQAVNLQTLNSKTSDPLKLDFVPQTSVQQPYKLARIYYDSATNTFVGYTDITNTALNIGSELRARLLNDTGSPLLNGYVVSFKSSSGGVITVDLANAKDFDSSVRAFGVLTVDISDTEQGYAVKYGAVRDLNTSAWDVGDPLYVDPENPGMLINTRPESPYYPIRVAGVVISDAVNGVIGVDFNAFQGTDTEVNSQGLLDGLLTQTPDVEITSNGTTITATVTNEEHPGRDLPFLLMGVRYELPTGQSVTVPPGADSNTLQTSILYVYLNSGVPTLAIATTPPSIPYCTVCEFAVFNAARTQTDGKPFAYRRSNNSISAHNSVNDGALGLFFRTLYAIRKKLGSNWLSGQDATPTVNDTTIKVALSTGKAMQFNETSVPLFDGNNYVVYNDTSNNATYAASTNLTSITSTAAGVSLLSNNRFYTIRLFYLLNSNGVGNTVIATRPLGFYTTAQEAINDSNNYTVNVNDTSIEEIIFPLYDIVISRTGVGGATISLVQLTDLRTKLAGGFGGGGAGGGGADDKVRITAADTNNDYLDAKFTPGSEFTKETTNPGANETLTLKFKNWFFNIARTFKVIFNVESLTADRTFTWPDKSDTIATLSDLIGRVYKENDVSVTARNVRNVITNGYSTLSWFSDDAVSEETDESPQFLLLTDVDPTGIQNGDLFVYNSTSGKFEPISTSNFDQIQNATEANISSDIQLSTILPAGYKIDTIIIKETSGNAAGNISLGTAASGTQIVNAATVGSSAVVDATLVEDFFSDVNDTDIYISSSAWGSGVVQVYFTFKKVI